MLRFVIYAQEQRKQIHTLGEQEEDGGERNPPDQSFFYLLPTAIRIGRDSETGDDQTCLMYSIADRGGLPPPSPRSRIVFFRLRAVYPSS
jgi:hypothetical protein